MTQLHYLFTGGCSHVAYCHACYAKDVFPNTHPEDRAHKNCSQKCHTVSFFVPVTSTFDAKFELRRDFCTMHLTTKFHHPTLNCLEVIMLTNKQTNNYTACADFSTGVVDRTTEDSSIKCRTRTVPQRTTPKQNATLFRFFLPDDFDL